MHQTKNVNWFKQEIEAQLHEYEVVYRFFEQGDFGSLNQVVFEGKSKGGQIDFWGMGWLGIFLWDKVKEVEQINILLLPEEQAAKDEWLDKLFKCLIHP